MKLKIAAKEARNWGGLQIETAGASTAERIDGGFRMNGRKSWIGNAALADMTEIWDGTSELQRLAISRALTGR